MKKVVVLTIVCLFMFGNYVYAHTGLQSSNPENASTVTEELSEITLTFETQIEQTSSFELQNANGETVAVNNSSIEGNTMTGSIAEPLKNGEYQVVWNIIGVDGHPIEGEFSFTVDIPAKESSNDSSQDSEQGVTGSKESEKSNQATETETSDNSETDGSNEQTETKSAEEGQEESSNSIMIGIVVVLVLVLAGSVWWMMRRKK
ncbi:copper resistance CopC family protein [Halobacillus hunanensis]|uniref:copper resistance CopC family protein n=1 Tax=Halobacillus hunanensis TaxID=578214 RepID=UPI0015908B1D|nr:copper resistance CopC family protein [Halobacillus hunanensis]